MSKQKFKIINWPAYNNALRQRGSLTVWLDEYAIAEWTDSLIFISVLLHYFGCFQTLIHFSH